MFELFSDKVAALSPDGPTDFELSDFLLEQEELTRIYYAPFDYVNHDARVIIVGITPGRNSMLNGFKEATAALKRGDVKEEVLRAAKLAGSFSNMRFRIAEMLDQIGLQSVLGLESCKELFAERQDFLHTTSCIRYPVFRWSNNKQKWTNYSGHAPKLSTWSAAVRFAKTYLLEELSAIPNALIVPCGKAVDEMLKYLATQELIDGSRCLFGFPHASGANGHRKKAFSERRASLEKQIREWSEQNPH